MARRSGQQRRSPHRIAGVRAQLPGSLKNAIDWVIGTGELEGKIVAITAAVPGPDRGKRGLQALRDTLGAVSAVVVGGAPIVRGSGFDDDVKELLQALISKAAEPRPARGY